MGINILKVPRKMLGILVVVLLVVTGTTLLVIGNQQESLSQDQKTLRSVTTVTPSAQSSVAGSPLLSSSLASIENLSSPSSVVTVSESLKETEPPVSASVTQEPPRIQFVPQADPESLLIDFGGRFATINAPLLPMAFAKPLEPPGGDQNAGNAFWIASGLGSDIRPGSETDNSFDVIGHSWGKAGHERVFNPLSEYALQGVDMASPTVDVNGTITYPIRNLDGLTLQVTTQAGVLIYQMSEAFAVAKSDLEFVQRVWNDDQPVPVSQSILPNRLVLITCAVDAEEGDKDYSVVVFAYLISAVPN